MQSNFSSHTLAEIFRDLYLTESSGVLGLSRGGETRNVHFTRGLLHYAESELETESLGPVLVAEGKISAGALAEAQRGLPSGAALPEALLNRGLITRAELSASIRQIVERVVSSVFTWDGGEARFAEAPPGRDLMDSDVLVTFEIILGGVVSQAGFGLLHDAMMCLENRLRFHEPKPIPLEKLKLSPSHGFILSRVDGGSTCRDILSILPPEEAELAMRFIFGMLVMGVLEFEPALVEGRFGAANVLRDQADRNALERRQSQLVRQAYQQMQSQVPSEVLGVQPDATREEVERAYEKAKTTFSRERILPSVREQHRAELGLIDNKMIEAYLLLSKADPGSSSVVTATTTGGASHATGGGEDRGVDDLLVRVEMDKTKSKLEQEEARRIADSYYTKARKSMRDNDYHNAIQYGKLAISYCPDNAAFYFLVADCQARNPEARWQRMAEQNYTKATQLDPWKVDYWISLGQFYKKRGLKMRARRQFEEALKLVPNHEVAVRELETLGV